jgi:hypothetical protein
MRLRDLELGNARAFAQCLARGRALDANCQGKTEADALTGLAEYYEHVARELHNAARDAAREAAVATTSEGHA